MIIIQHPDQQKCNTSHMSNFIYCFIFIYACLVWVYVACMQIFIYTCLSECMSHVCRFYLRMSVWVYVACMQMLGKARKRHQSPWSWDHRQLWVAWQGHWGLEWCLLDDLKSWEMVSPLVTNFNSFSTQIRRNRWNCYIVLNPITQKLSFEVLLVYKLIDIFPILFWD